MNPEKTNVQKAKRKAAYELLEPDGGVVGVGIGRAGVGGERKNCLRVYVLDKDYVKVPEEILEVPTRVIEVGRFGRTPQMPCCSRPMKTPRLGSPIRIRTTVPNVNEGQRGTLGALVKRGSDRYILSCNHILRVNGRVPDDAEIVSAEFVGREKILAKPGPFKRLDHHAHNSMDCAIALVNDGVAISPKPKDSKTRLGSTEPIDPETGFNVYKVGAVTGYTEGKIIDTDVDLYVNYSFGSFRFDHQLLIDGGKDSQFATRGDSGSLVIDRNTRRATALIFAASGRYAVASPIRKVLECFEVELV
jgi:hypothetical protein